MTNTTSPVPGECRVIWRELYGPVHTGHQPAPGSALFTVPAVPAASVPVPAPPLPLTAAAAGRGASVVAVLLVTLRC